MWPLPGSHIAARAASESLRRQDDETTLARLRRMGAVCGCFGVCSDCCVDEGQARTMGSDPQLRRVVVMRHLNHRASRNPLQGTDGARAPKDPRDLKRHEGH